MCQNHIAKMLKKLREDAGYSIEKIAQYFCGDSNKVKNWENGVDVPSAYDCFVLSELYDVSIDSMFSTLTAKELIPEDKQDDYCRESWINRLTKRYAG